MLFFDYIYIYMRVFAIRLTFELNTVFPSKRPLIYVLPQMKCVLPFTYTGTSQGLVFVTLMEHMHGVQ